MVFFKLNEEGLFLTATLDWFFNQFVTRTIRVKQRVIDIRNFSQAIMYFQSITNGTHEVKNS